MLYNVPCTVTVTVGRGCTVYVGECVYSLSGVGCVQSIGGVCVQSMGGGGVQSIGGGGGAV